MSEQALASPTTPSTEETYDLNMGPQHPSMHGVLRLLLELRGEEIKHCEPVIGYAHRAHEKMAENRSYIMFMPNTSRVDYLSGGTPVSAWRAFLASPGKSGFARPVR